MCGACTEKLLDVPAEKDNNNNNDHVDVDGNRYDVEEVLEEKRVECWRKSFRAKVFTLCFTLKNSADRECEHSFRCGRFTGGGDKVSG